MEGGNNAGNRRGGGRRERSDVSNSSGSKSQTAQELDDELDAYVSQLETVLECLLMV